MMLYKNFADYPMDRWRWPNFSPRVWACLVLAVIYWFLVRLFGWTVFNLRGPRNVA